MGRNTRYVRRWAMVPLGTWMAAGRTKLLVAVMLAVALALPDPGHAQDPRPGRKAVQPAAAPPTPTPPVALPDPPIPVQQARQVGLDQCAPILDLMARQTLTSRYDVQSGWSRTDPTHHVFQSVAALNSPGNTPPDGVAALVAAPLADGTCDGVSMQVFPLAGDCPSAQKAMLKDGRLLAPMLNTRIMLDAKGNRVVLLPAYKDTCIAIAVDTRFGRP